MTIALNNLVVRQDIVDRFNSRVRDWVASRVTWVAGTGVWDTNVATVTSSSSTRATTQTYSNLSAAAGYSLPGGSVNRGTHSDPTEAGVTTGHLATAIGASKTTGGHVVSLLKSFMVLYANTHTVQLINNGNYAYPSNAIIAPGQVIYQGTIRMDGCDAGTANAIAADVDAYANARGIATGITINAAQMNQFIEDCRNIWTNRAYNVVVEQYRYLYCHGSCHSNVPPHGSRSRR